jgi:hypothetical protein
MEAGMEPTTSGQVTDPVAFTREHLQMIAAVWIDAAKRTLGPYVEKAPAPIAKYLKPLTSTGTAPAT